MITQQANLVDRERELDEILAGYLDAAGEPLSSQELNFGANPAARTRDRRVFPRRTLTKMTWLLALAGSIVFGTVTIWIIKDGRRFAVRVPDETIVEITMDRGDPVNVVIGPSPPRPTCQFGWWRSRYDLAGTSFYPFPSTRRTSNRLEKVDWKPERVFGSISSVVTGDINGDGFVEILLHDAETLAAFDRRGKELWRASLRIDSWVEVPPGRIAATAGPELADFDNDGTLEIVLVTGSRKLKGWHDKAPQRAIIYDGDGEVLKNMPVIDGAFGRPQKCFDFDRDGRTDIVIAMGAYRHPHAICIYDWVTGNVLFRTDFADATDVVGVGDANGDGHDELFIIQGFDCHVDTPVGDYDADHCYAAFFDSQGNRLWYQTYDHSLTGCLADLDADGTLEIILLHEPEGTPSRGAFHLLDPETGEPAASFQGLGVAINRCWSVADVTGDGRGEFVVGDGDMLRVINADLGLVASQPAPNTRVVAANDLNGDGRVEIVAQQGTDLIVLDGNLNELSRYRTEGEIRGAVISDVDSDGVNEVMLLAGELGNTALEIVHFAPAEPHESGIDTHD